MQIARFGQVVRMRNEERPLVAIGTREVQDAVERVAFHSMMRREREERRVSVTTVTITGQTQRSFTGSLSTSTSMSAVARMRASRPPSDHAERFGQVAEHALVHVEEAIAVVLGSRN